MKMHLLQMIKISKKNEYNNINDIEYENEIVDNKNYNWNYNNKNSYPYKGNIRKRGTNKKYYINNKKYNAYDNNQNYNGYYNSGNNNQQPKKQITKIKLNEKNAKNLKELFEIGHTKTPLEAKEVEINKEMTTKTNINNNNEEIHKNSTNNINENINMTMSDNNNLSNIKMTNDEGIEDDNIGEELFGNKKQKEIFNYQSLLSKRISGERTEEMNPTFLNDIKTNNAFDAEQELIKSLKKETNKDKDKEKDNKDMSNNGELSKEEFDIDFSNSSHFNFDYYFFDGDTNQQKSNDEGQMTGNYEDFKFKSIIDNLNMNDNFIYEEQKGKLDQLLSNNSNREESEDQKEEIEDSFKENEYERFLLNKQNFNYEDNGNNYYGLNNEDRKFQYKLDGYQKSFEKMWRK